MPRLTKAERDLRHVRAERDAAVNGRIAWMQRCEVADKETVLKQEQVDYWIGRERAKAQECDRYIAEIKRLLEKIENREAYIGRLCIDKQVIR